MTTSSIVLQPGFSEYYTDLVNAARWYEMFWKMKRSTANLMHIETLFYQKFCIENISSNAGSILYRKFYRFVSTKWLPASFASLCWRRSKSSYSLPYKQRNLLNVLQAHQDTSRIKKNLEKLATTGSWERRETSLSTHTQHFMLWGAVNCTPKQLKL